MKFILHTPIISPHQFPLAHALVKRMGVENTRYVYTESLHGERVKMGWGDVVEEWCVIEDELLDKSELENADVLFTYIRNTKLLLKRLESQKLTFYSFERWFKPPIGFLRVFVPSYFKMVLRFLKCLKSPKFMLLPMGIHAARDFARLMGLFKGDICCLFRAPKVAFESKPGGRIVSLKAAINAGVLSKEAIAFGKKYGFVQIPKEHWGKLTPKGMYAKMRLWGYFVASSNKSGATKISDEQLASPSMRRSYVNISNDKQSDNSNIASNLSSTDSNEIMTSSFDASISNSEFLIPNCMQRVQGEGGHSLPIKHPPRALWVGRMLDWKRVDVLVRASRPHPDLKRVDFLVKSGERRAESGDAKISKSEVVEQELCQQSGDSEKDVAAPQGDSLITNYESRITNSINRADVMHLSIYGHGPEEKRLRKLCKDCPNITFHDFVPVEKVRELMRAHDVYVLPSNGYEGWGAVVSEALEEGMMVLGSVEAGSSATILPPTHLFKSGDVKRLSELLRNEISEIDIGAWTAENAADALFMMAKKFV